MKKKDKTLEQQMKDQEKMSVIWSSVFCAVLLLIIIAMTIERVQKVKSGETETDSWLTFASVLMIIALIYIFVVYVVLAYLDYKKNGPDDYEEFQFQVIRVKWHSNETLVENLSTGEQFWLFASGMKEKEIYRMLRSKRSKLYAYELVVPVEENHKKIRWIKKR